MFLLVCNFGTMMIVSYACWLSCVNISYWARLFHGPIKQTAFQLSGTPSHHSTSHCVVSCILQTLLNYMLVVMRNAAFRRRPYKQNAYFTVFLLLFVCCDLFTGSYRVKLTLWWSASILSTSVLFSFYF